jgi:amino acid transporter
MPETPGMRPEPLRSRDAFPELPKLIQFYTDYRPAGTGRRPPGRFQYDGWIMREVAPKLARELGLRDLVLFNVAAVVSIRWLTTAARIGPGSLWLWAGAALLFFVPLALAVARLNERYPEEGGIYAWTGASFGDWHGFLCGWCYWISNLFYFPNLLLSGIGIAFFTFGERGAALADDPPAMAAACLLVLWTALMTNIVGLRVGKWTQNAGAAATCAAGGLLMLAGATALFSGQHATLLLSAPEWKWASLNYWPQIAFAFGGLELGAIMSGEIRDPQRTVRRAAWISGILVAALYMLGTTSILVLVPADEIHIVTGLGQAAQAAAARSGIEWAGPALAALVAVGLLGQFGAWFSGNARVAFVIGLDRYLPQSFGRVHPRWKTPHYALLAQGVVCTGFLILLAAGENLKAAYQLLVDMMVVTYFIPFLYLFAAAWRNGQRAIALAGAMVTIAGIAFSFAPPEDAASVWLFEAKLAGSCIATVATARWLFGRAGRLRA